MDEPKAHLLTRRKALRSLGALAAGTLLKPAAVFGVEPVKNNLRFAVLGDWGTGKSAADGIAGQMSRVHAASPFDFVIAAGDNIYPDGCGRRFVKNFEQPFAALATRAGQFPRRARQPRCAGRAAGPVPVSAL